MSGEFLGTFEPDKVLLSVNGFPITGFSDSPIEIDRAEDSFRTKVGNHGDVSRAKNANRTGTIKFTLQQTSTSNAFLSALAKMDEETGKGVVPVLCKEIGTANGCFSPKSWVVKPAKMDEGSEVSDREWTIFCTKLEMNSSGNGA